MMPGADRAPGQSFTITETLLRLWQEFSGAPLEKFTPPTITAPLPPKQKHKFDKMQATILKEADLAFSEASWRFFSSFFKTLLRAELIYSIFPDDEITWKFIETLMRAMLGSGVANAVFQNNFDITNISSSQKYPETHSIALLITWIPAIIELSKEILNARSRFTIARNNAHPRIKWESKIKAHNIQDFDRTDTTPLIPLSHVFREIQRYPFSRHSFKKPEWPLYLPPLNTFDEKVQNPKPFEYYSDLSTQELKANKILRNVMYGLIEQFFTMVVFFAKDRPSFSEEPTPIILTSLTAVLATVSLLMIARIKLSQITKMRDYYSNMFDMVIAPPPAHPSGEFSPS